MTPSASSRRETSATVTLAYAVAAVLARRVDRADAGHPERRRAAARHVHDRAVRRPRASTRSPSIRSTVSSCVWCSPPWCSPIRPACSAASAANARNHACTTSRSSRVATRARRARTRLDQLPSLEEADVLVHDGRPAGQRRRPPRRTPASPEGSVRATRILSTGVDRAGQGPGGRVSASAARTAGTAGTVRCASRRRQAPRRRPARLPTTAGARAARRRPRRSATARCVTDETTVVSTGSRARCSSAAARKACGSSVMSTVKSRGRRARSWTKAREPAGPRPTGFRRRGGRRLVSPRGRRPDAGSLRVAT